jgi:hypothetical protein
MVWVSSQETKVAQDTGKIVPFTQQRCVTFFVMIVDVINYKEGKERKKEN